MAANGGGVAMKAGAVVQGAGGRFVGTPELTEQQAGFVASYLANGERQTEAARQAGYAHPEQEGWRLMRNPAVWQAILDGQRRQASRLRAVGIRTLERLATDPTTPPGCARDCALDLVAIGDRWAGEQASPDKADSPAASASEQTAKIMRLLGPSVTLNVGVPPRSEPDPVTITGQAIDLKG